MMVCMSNDKSTRQTPDDTVRTSWGGRYIGMLRQQGKRVDVFIDDVLVFSDVDAVAVKDGCIVVVDDQTTNLLSPGMETVRVVERVTTNRLSEMADQAVERGTSERVPLSEL